VNPWVWFWLAVTPLSLVGMVVLGVYERREYEREHEWEQPFPFDWEEEGL
jgi:heme exporter protein D